MQIISDLQLHSKYARAVSKNMTLENMALWAEKKGIDLITCGDWTHPIWGKEIRDKLIETSEGVYGLRKWDVRSETRFLLVTEVSLQYYQGTKYRAVHILIFAPNLEVVEKINQEFTKRGVDLSFDGRPPMKLSCEDLMEVVLGIDERCLVIPAHSWTPWFGFYGAHGGFDSIEEAFGKYSKYIYAVETGLDSDPAMNWRIKELDSRNIVSFSDAHSLQKIGREATVFEVPQLTYGNIRDAIVGHTQSSIAYTIEFYRQEGKYHATGHRKCGVVYLPADTPKDYICPICGKKLTVGAAQRTEDLAARIEYKRSLLHCSREYSMDTNSVRWVTHPDGKRPPFVNLVPLQEILSEVYKVGVGSKKVQREYEKLVLEFGSEFRILLEVDLKELKDERLKEAIEKNRRGEVIIKPGYDGVFGEVKIDFKKNVVAESLQMGLI